jgi:hypothetical protein
MSLKAVFVKFARLRLHAINSQSENLTPERFAEEKSQFVNLQ